MTLSELTTLLLSWVDDANGAYFTSAQTNLFLNRAQQEVQKQLIQAGEMYYTKAVETTTVANQGDYVLPSDFMIVNRLELVLSGSGTSEDKRYLVPISLNEQYKFGIQTGTPEVYAIKKDRITLFPTPDAALTLRLYYSYRVTDMSSSSDSPDVPTEYHEYVALLAARDCFIKDDRPLNNLETKINYYLRLMKETYEDRRQDQSRFVIETGDNDWGRTY